MTEIIRNEVLNLLEETFQTHHGAFLYKGTTFLETLDTIDHQLASKPFPNMEETIAGHVYHVIFYMRVLLEYITDVRTGKTEWQESWIVKKVNPGEWSKLKEDLRLEYDKVARFIRHEEGKWNESDFWGGILSILSHSAYHLGAIRQLKEF